LAPEVIASNATGGGAVWMVIKVRFEFIMQKLKEQDKRLERLENLEFADRRQVVHKGE
jgi:hypothetical protein